MSRRSTAEILRAARKRIEDPERWTRGSEARDDEGWSVVPWDSDAVCWCAVGAIKAQRPGRTVRQESLGALAAAIGGQIPSLNDGPRHISGRHPRPAPARHKRVLAAFDKAIELAEEAP